MPKKTLPTRCKSFHCPRKNTRRKLHSGDWAAAVAIRVYAIQLFSSYQRVEWHFFLRLLQLEIKDLHVTLELFHFHKIHQNRIMYLSKDNTNFKKGDKFVQNEFLWFSDFDLKMRGGHLIQSSQLKAPVRSWNLSWALANMIWAKSAREGHHRQLVGIKLTNCWYSCMVYLIWRWEEAIQSNLGN